MMCWTHNLIGKIYKASVTLLLIFISLSILSCTRQPDERKYLIGIINLNPALEQMVGGFKEGMAENGYIEGKNVTYLNVKDAGDMDAALRSLKDRKANLILTITLPALEKAQNAVRGSGIPIVGISFDPVRGGIVDSMVYKKENTTGVKIGGTVQKALEWLLLISPKTKRIFVPVAFDTRAAQLSLTDLKDAAAKLKVDLLVADVENLDDLQSALSSIPKDIDAVFILHSILIVSNLDLIVEKTIKRRLPTASGSGFYRNGVTISYGQDHAHTGKQASKIAHKILKGYPASSLPFETVDLFLGINLDNARKIGLEIPEHILKQAEVIKPSGTANNN